MFLFTLLLITINICTSTPLLQNGTRAKIVIGLKPNNQTLMEKIDGVYDADIKIAPNTTYPISWKQTHDKQTLFLFVSSKEDFPRVNSLIYTFLKTDNKREKNAIHDCSKIDLVIDSINDRIAWWKYIPAINRLRVLKFWAQNDTIRLDNKENQTKDPFCLEKPIDDLIINYSSSVCNQMHLVGFCATACLFAAKKLLFSRITNGPIFISCSVLTFSLPHILGYEYTHPYLKTSNIKQTLYLLTLVVSAGILYGTHWLMFKH